jgi:guanylate kinase
VRSTGRICILDIDIQGVKSIKRSPIACKYVFIMPPSMEALEKRLRGRGTETEDKIQIRLKNAREEIQYGEQSGNFDAVIVNSDLEEAYSKLVDILGDLYPEHRSNISNSKASSAHKHPSTGN